MNKKKVILAAAAVVAAVGIAGTVLGGGGKPALPVYTTTTLEKTDLQNTVSATGIVESENTSKVYASTSGKVETVNVKVGDRVKAGDVLCQMDTEDLELTIQSAQASLNHSQNLANFNISMSQKKYDQAKENIEDGLDAQIQSAKSALDSAKDAYYDAKSAYNDADDDDDNDGKDQAYQALKQAYESLKQAQNAEEEPKKVYADANELAQKAQANRDEALTALEGATEENKAQLEQAFNLAQAKYEQAKAAADQAYAAYLPFQQATVQAEAMASQKEAVYNAYFQDSDALDQLEKAYDSAKTAYKNAKQNMEIAENSSQQTLDSLADQITSSKLSGDTTTQQLELQKLNKQLSEATVTSPIDGVVTAVYAKEGTPGSGLLFVVEDVDDLKISTKIQEYDIGSVEVGMDAIIKSDGTGDNAFDGILSMIAPVAEKNASGDVAAGTTVEFASEIDVAPGSDGLKVGMNARVSIVTSQRKGVFGVPYDAVTYLTDGSAAIFTAAQEGEQTVARAIPVTTGLETDYLMEVSGEGLTEGMEIISNPTGLVDGMAIALMDGVQLAEQAGSGTTAAAAMMG